jgi:hypothetical protein
MEDGRIARDMVDQTLREHAGLGLADRPLAEHVHQPVAFLLDYNDGLRAALLQLNNYYGQRWFYAARVNGRVVTCEFRYLDEPRQLVQPVAAFSCTPWTLPTSNRCSNGACGTKPHGR